MPDPLILVNYISTEWIPKIAVVIFLVVIIGLIIMWIQGNRRARMLPALLCPGMCHFQVKTLLGAAPFPGLYPGWRIITQFGRHLGGVLHLPLPSKT